MQSSLIQKELSMKAKHRPVAEHARVATLFVRTVLVALSLAVIGLPAVAAADDPEHAMRICRGVNTKGMNCDQRAAAWSRALQEAGMKPTQITTFSTPDNLVYREGAWNCHTAPLLDTPQGPRVIDPTWFPERPATCKEWHAAFGGNPVIHEVGGPYTSPGGRGVADKNAHNEMLRRAGYEPSGPGATPRGLGAGAEYGLYGLPRATPRGLGAGAESGIYGLPRFHGYAMPPSAFPSGGISARVLLTNVGRFAAETVVIGGAQYLAEETLKQYMITNGTWHVMNATRVTDPYSASTHPFAYSLHRYAANPEYEWARDPRLPTSRNLIFNPKVREVNECYTPYGGDPNRIYVPEHVLKTLVPAAPAVRPRAVDPYVYNIDTGERSLRDNRSLAQMTAQAADGVVSFFSGLGKKPEKKRNVLREIGEANR